MTRRRVDRPNVVTAIDGKRPGGQPIQQPCRVVTGRCLTDGGLSGGCKGSRRRRGRCVLTPSRSRQRSDAENASGGNRRRRTSAAEDLQARLCQGEKLGEGTDGLGLAEGQ